MTAVPVDCLRCGTCCFSDLPTYVRVTGDDHERLGDAADSLVHFEGNRAYMRMEDGHCAALGIAPNGEYACRIYPLRPQTCRDLEQGSGACEGELETKRERPLLALKALLRQKEETRRT